MQAIRPNPTRDARRPWPALPARAELAFVEDIDLCFDGSGETARRAAPESTDFPAPVGPRMSMWPTSPTWVEKRNGVEPLVTA